MRVMPPQVGVRATEAVGITGGFIPPGLKAELLFGSRSLIVPYANIARIVKPRVNTTPRCREDSLLSFGRNGTRFSSSVRATRSRR